MTEITHNYLVQECDHKQVCAEFRSKTAHLIFVSPSLSGQTASGKSRLRGNNSQADFFCPSRLELSEAAARRGVLLRLLFVLLWLRPSTTVAFEVSVQGAFGLEALPTDATAVGFLSSVDQNVSFQVHILDEPLPTHLAQKAALLVVEAHVRVERLFLGEAFPTDAAGEGLLAAVDLQVRLQVPALVEGLPADAAAVGFLSGVDPQVHLQRGVSGERLPAHVTRVAAVRVRAQVSGEAGAGLILVPAEAAAAVWVIQVTLRVRR